MQVFGIDWVGVNAENGRKLILSVGFVLVVLTLAAVLRRGTDFALQRRDQISLRLRFWTRQGVSLLSTGLVVLGLLSVWFNDPTRLATVFGLISAGLAFALQQVVTSFAGYFVILRGATFNVGDRISMGGVRGDVLSLSFIQTTIMEMGQPPAISGDPPSMWVHSRQFTGRIVTVTNSKIFDEPVYNYSRDFPFLWEEMSIPISYQTDRVRVEEILLEAARQYSIDAKAIAIESKEELQRRFGVEPIDLEPRVYWRITDNWMELTVRFLTGTHFIRGVKDGMSRYIIGEFDKAGIGIASSTYDIVGFPPIEIKTTSASTPASDPPG